VRSSEVQREVLENEGRVLENEGRVLENEGRVLKEQEKEGEVNEGSRKYWSEWTEVPQGWKYLREWRIKVGTRKPYSKGAGRDSRPWKGALEERCKRGELFILPRYQSTVFILLGGLKKGYTKTGKYKEQVPHIILRYPSTNVCEELRGRTRNIPQHNQEHS
jgi:hypothetical protein